MGILFDSMLKWDHQLYRELRDQVVAPPTYSLFWHQTLSFFLTKAFHFRFISLCSFGALFVLRQTLRLRLVLLWLKKSFVKMKFTKKLNENNISVSKCYDNIFSSGSIFIFIVPSLLNWNREIKLQNCIKRERYWMIHHMSKSGLKIMYGIIFFF